MTMTDIPTVKTTASNTDPIAVIPTTLVRLEWKIAAHLADTLTEEARPNLLVDSTLLEESTKDHYFWLDLVQLVREAPDIAQEVKKRHCRVSAGCRINTRQEARLKSIMRNLERGAYGGNGTSWINLGYAVVAAKAQKISAALAGRGSIPRLCVWQRELPITSLHAVPPQSTWKQVPLPRSWVW